MTCLQSVILITGAVISSATVDPRPALIPLPARLSCGSGLVHLRADMAVMVAGGPEAVAVGEYLAAQLRKTTGLDLEVRQVGAHASASGSLLLRTLDTAGAPLQLAFVRAEPEAVAREGYELDIGESGVVLRAAGPQGLFRGVHTLQQLLITTSTPQGPRAALPKLRIQDWPRYRLRGLLLDCCRHFMPVDFIKRTIDLLAVHKMNVLHWHLTEDQGWRLHVERYPELTRVGAWRGGAAERYGGFYTREQVREIVRYAAQRYITVVPEIEMPGHALAALAAYPQLSCTGGPFEVSTRWGVHADVYCAGNDDTFTFLEHVLDEVVELFPSEFIHIGGDECPKTRWRACPRCQRRMRDHGLADEHELQSWFIRRIERHLDSRGRRLIGWDEIIEGGLAPNATVQAWRSMEAAVQAARGGHDVIASPTSHCYLDYSHEAIPLRRAYLFEPVPPGLTPAEARHILGAEGNMWTEHAPPQRVDRQVWPRLCALAEVTWSPPELRDWQDFSLRMQAHYRRLDELGVDYYAEPPQCGAGPRVFTDRVEVTLLNPLGRGTVHYTLDGSTPTAGSPPYVAPLQLGATTVVKAVTVLGGSRLTDTVEFRFEKQLPRPPDEVSALTRGLAYEYYEGSWSQLPEFGALQPVTAGTVETFDLSVRRRDDHFALRFCGFIEVPADGVYTFHLESDDGSRLWIGRRLVVDHDGLHSASHRSGQIILRRGRHAITAACFEAGGAQSLQVEYHGPGVARQVIPATVLWRRRAGHGCR